MEIGFALVFMLFILVFICLGVAWQELQVQKRQIKYLMEIMPDVNNLAGALYKACTINEQKKKRTIPDYITVIPGSKIQ